MNFIQKNQALAERLNAVKDSFNKLEKQYGHEVNESRKIKYES